MHISEGVLSPTMLATGAAIAAAGIGIGLKSIRSDQIPKVGLMSAVFFFSSLVHVPVGPVHMHLVMNGIVGLVLGWAAFPAIFVGLFFQAYLFGYGGLTTLGVNTAIMALPALCSYGLFHLIAGRTEKPQLLSVTAFICGALAIALSAGLVALVMALTGEAFFEVAALAFAGNLPIMLVEGAITLFVVSFLKKVSPELIGLEPA